MQKIVSEGNLAELRRAPKSQIPKDLVRQALERGFVAMAAWGLLNGFEYRYAYLYKEDLRPWLTVPGTCGIPWCEKRGCSRLCKKHRQGIVNALEDVFQVYGGFASVIADML